MTKKRLYLIIFILIAAMVPWFTFAVSTNSFVAPIWVVYVISTTIIFAGIVALFLKIYWDTTAGNGWESN